MRVRWLALGIALFSNQAFSPGQEESLSNYWHALSAARSLDVVVNVAAPAGVNQAVAEGLLHLRRYELTLSPVEAAAGTKLLEVATREDSTNAWSHLALGMMLARGPQVRERPYREREIYVVRNGPAAARARREFEAALRISPRLTDAALELGQLALDLHNDDANRNARRRVQSLIHTDEPSVLLTAARLALPDGSTALSLLDRAEEVGLDTSVACYERALVFFRTSASAEEAVVWYFRGVERLSVQSANRYFAAIRLLASESESTAWQTATLTERRMWLKEFWSRRAALAGVPVWRRVAEHYRRMSSLGSTRFAPVVDETSLFLPSKTMAPRLEDANPGVVLTLRHGNPERMAHYLYCEPGWDTLSPALRPTVRECQCSPYGRMVARDLGAGVCGEIGPGSRPSAAEAALWRKLRPELDEMGKAGARNLLSVAAAASVQGDSYYPPYQRNLSLAWELVRFRGPDGTVEVVTAVGLPPSSTESLRAADRLIQFGLSVTLVDTVHNWIRQADASFSDRRNKSTQHSTLLAHNSVVTPPGKSVALRIRVEDHTGTAGVIAYGTVDLEKYDASSLSISDLLLSPGDAEGLLQRGALRLAIAPSRTFTRAEQPTLYYEVYGTRDSVLTTSIRISRVDAGNPILPMQRRQSSDVNLSFVERVSAEDPHYGVQQRRRLSLAELVPGTYRVTVTLSDLAGRTVAREKMFRLQ